jgi:glycosyltransferase involved in cell wall biosynthesis
MSRDASRRDVGAWGRIVTPASESRRPLVAVCTPVYNGEKYLAETMECVQAQSYPNVVHVVLDNASTDATPEIIDRYRGGRVPLLVGRNPVTVSAGENANLVSAMMPPDAAYFCQLCADDLLYPDALARMVEVMERDPAIGLVAAAEKNPKYQGWPEGEIFDGREAIAAYFRGDLPTAFAHCLYRREIYDARGPDFYDVRLNNDDVDIALWAMCRSKIGYVREPQVFTREHEETATAREMDRAKIHFAEWLVFLARYGAQALGEAEAKALGRRFRRYYFRRLLKWRFVARDLALVRRHLERLAVAGIQPSLLDYADAVADWPLKNIGLRPHWTIYPH